MMLGVVRQNLEHVTRTITFPLLRRVLERIGPAASVAGNNYSTIGKEWTVFDALSHALDEEMAADPRVVILGEVAEYRRTYTITRGLRDKYDHDRVRDTQVTKDEFMKMKSENFKCLRPVMEFKTLKFPMNTFKYAIHHFSKPTFSSDHHSVPIVFRGPIEISYDFRNSECLASLLSSYDLKVLAPYSSEDARGLLKAAIRDPDPVIFLENSYLYGQSFPVSQEALNPNFFISIGEAKIEREGKHVTIASFSNMVSYALQAAEILSKDGISVEVINLRTILPLDKDAISVSFKKTKRLITLEGGKENIIGKQIRRAVVEKGFHLDDDQIVNITICTNRKKLGIFQVMDIVRTTNILCKH